MKYERTPEIRAKQSATMKAKHASGSHDYSLIVAKRKQTISSLGKKSGRPRKFIESVCLTCGSVVYRQKYCSNRCYSVSARGRAPSPLSVKALAEYNKRPRASRLTKEELADYKKFKNRVYRLSEKTYKEWKWRINPDDHPRRRHGVDGGWQLDHIVTVREGFDCGLSPEELSREYNLRLLPWRDNLKRNWDGN